MIFKNHRESRRAIDGKKLKAARGKATDEFGLKMTQAKLAEELRNNGVGISQQMISEYERCQRKSIHIDDLKKLAKILALSSYTDLLSHNLAARERAMPDFEDISSEGDVRVDRTIPEMNPVERAVKDTLYYYPGGYVGAIRLSGAGDQFYTERMVELRYQHKSIDYPLWYFTKKDRIIAASKKEARVKKTLYFDGPNTRLINWCPFVRNDERVALEEKRLRLVLGPVGWYDWDVLYRGIKEEEPLNIEKLTEGGVRILDLAKDKDVSHSRLSNLFCSAATLVSSDGYIGYSFRTMVSAVPNLYSSSVAENTNRFFDEADPRDSTQLVNRLERPVVIEKGPSNEYKPKRVPHPFSTVRRGIQEELSAKLLDYIPPNGIKLTGLSFSLDTFCPYAQFVVFVDMDRGEIFEICKENPGKDYSEGQLYFMRPDFSDPETADRLNNNAWVYGGKVSVVRAIQLLEEVKRRHDSFDDVFNFLANAE